MFDRIKKNAKSYIIFVCIGIIVFLLSYTVSISVLRGNDGILGFLGDAKETNALGEGSAIINKDTEVKFVLNYGNCINKVKASENLEQPINVEQDKLLGLTEKEADKIFSSFGYKVDKFSSDEVVFEKSIPGFKYENESYFIGVAEENVVIYKSNSNDTIEIAQDKIINPKGDGTSYLQIKDIENRGNLLKTFYEGKADYQFSDIQEAIEYAQALCST